ncbi:MAG: hypothetical protein MI739_09690 [Bacteroidales bacterium]|nr:hypothetical protein [Bacteroidales bacterium]
MSKDFEDLQKMWDAEKSQIALRDCKQEIMQINSNKDKSVFFHYKNIVILSVILVFVILFLKCLGLDFYSSKIGAMCMFGGLVLRIAIEILSVMKARRIDFTRKVLDTIQKTREFYSFRRKVHIPITIAIITIYSIGFFLLTPEFLQWFSKPMVLFIDISFLVIAFILIKNIRKPVRQELLDLEKIIQLQNEILN